MKINAQKNENLFVELFMIVLEALSREFRTGLPWVLLYADDLVLMADRRTGNLI